jgi:Ca2+-binding RTX toxin-like protein
VDTGAGSGVSVDLAASGPQNTGGGGIDVFDGIEGIRDSSFNDTFYGSNRTDLGENWDISSGDDFVDGRGGRDQVRFEFASAGVTVSLATTSAQNVGNGLGLKTLLNIEDLSGSAFDDTLIGDSGTNWLNGRAGQDSIIGGGGGDVIFGELGNDTLEGGSGYDSLFGGEGNDVLRGGNSTDAEAAVGGFRAEIFLGGPGDDILIGGDSVTDSANDVDWAFYTDATSAVTVSLAITGSQNTLGAGIDTLIGMDALAGSNFDDRLTGNAANNALFGGLGNDTLNGGGGNDIISLVGATAAATVDLRITGPQTIANFGADTLISIESVYGWAFGDQLTGNGAANGLLGDLGDDALSGLGGDDTLDGGAGADTLNGGAGNDTLNGGGDFDLVSNGPVTVDLNITTVAQATGGAGLDVIVGVEGVIGSNSDDVLIGDASANRFEGRGGADSITAGGGNDTILGGGGNDTVRGGGGEDLVQGESGNDSLFGGADNDRIEGFAGADVINGDDGDDVILAGAGNDTVIGAIGNDSITGGQGRDSLTGGEGGDRFIYTAVSDSSRGAGARDVILDFSSAAGDKIDLSAIDGNAGAAGFQNILASQLTFTAVAGGFLVNIDVLGTPGIDMAIEVRTPTPLSAGDFIL